MSSTSAKCQDCTAQKCAKGSETRTTLSLQQRDGCSVFISTRSICPSASVNFHSCRESFKNCIQRCQRDTRLVLCSPHLNLKTIQDIRHPSNVNLDSINEGTEPQEEKVVSCIGTTFTLEITCHRLVLNVICALTLRRDISSSS